MTFDIPPVFAQSTIDRELDLGTDWLARLPGIVADLLGRWECVRDGDVMHGGMGLILPVRRRSGQAMVLKVSFPHPDNGHEPDAYAAWDGRGAVQLHERDDKRYAMLLERGETSTLGHIQDADEVMAVAGRISRRLAVPAPPGLPRLQDQAAGWEDQLLKDVEELTPELPRRVVDAALETVRELGHDQPETLVHGDLHPGNILRAEREPWLAIDPEGRVGDPAYDAGTLLKFRAVKLLATGEVPEAALRRALDIFAEAAEVDRDRARRWAQLLAVQDSFWGRRVAERTADGGLDWLTQLGDHMAESLT